MKWLLLVTLVTVGLSTPANALSMKDCLLDPSEEIESRREHIYGGRPDGTSATELYERRGYVITYNEDLKVPVWAAWHATKAYRDTPERKSRWKSFRRDAEAETATDDDYVGWHGSEHNFARGHIVPYYISGGDRDGDGLDAEFEDTLKIEDKDDACTVYEINSMINIAPQYHSRFNGGSGVWYALETEVRDMVDGGQEFWIFAGTVFDASLPVQRIGDRDEAESSWSIGVPHGFWKVVVSPARAEAVAFLFDHQGDLEDGCQLDDVRQPSQCIVDLTTLEPVTGLRFFDYVEAEAKTSLRSSSSKETWLDWLGIRG